MKNLFIISLLLVGKTFAQSTLLSPNSVKIPNLSVIPTCNVAAKGTQVFNTNDNKMYFCNGTAWTDMTTGGFTIPYSGNGNSTFAIPLFSLTNSGSGNTLYIENTGNARGIFIKSTGNGGGIRVENTTNVAVYGESDIGTGVYGKSGNSVGVYGISDSDYGVYAYSYYNFSAYLVGRAKVGSRLGIGSLSYAGKQLPGYISKQIMRVVGGNIFAWKMGIIQNMEKLCMMLVDEIRKFKSLVKVLPLELQPILQLPPLMIQEICQ